MNGVGAHEVVIEAPDHEATLASHAASTRWPTCCSAYRERVVDLKKDPRFEYVLVFKNHGEAAGGVTRASALPARSPRPIIPIMVTEELTGSAQYFEIKERCVWCDIVRQERRDAAAASSWRRNGFVALAPFAPRFPFETWILPTRHRSAFEETGVDELRGLADMLGEFLRRMERVLETPALQLHAAHRAAARGPASSTSTGIWRSFPS